MLFFSVFNIKIKNYRNMRGKYCPLVAAIMNAISELTADVINAKDSFVFNCRNHQLSQHNSLVV